jgi:peptide chain release factor 1
MLERLENIEKRYDELAERMALQEVASDLQQLQTLAQERAGIEYIVTMYRKYRATAKNLEDTRTMLNDGLDEEMSALVKQEIDELNSRLEKLHEEIKLALLPRDPNDDRNVIVEIRAGTGGEEAGLFAADLFRMYSRYAQSRGWNVDIISCSESGIGSYREIIFQIQGKGAYSRLKYERGVHRVQRVPVTEASGRIHTSTATIAVLPEANEVEVNIRSEDIKLEFYHSSGAGGQNVNKVATAVRITHLTTGMVVACQDERSQLKNRMKAMAVMRARLLEKEQNKQEEQLIKERRSQVGTGERSEKIRTYNFPQDRLTDHRIGKNFHNLPRIMSGDIDELIDTLATTEHTRQLEEQLV